VLAGPLCMLHTVNRAGPKWHSAGSISRTLVLCCGLCIIKLSIGDFSYTTPTSKNSLIGQAQKSHDTDYYTWVPLLTIGLLYSVQYMEVHAIMLLSCFCSKRLGEKIPQ
jgi:hypothetical protein